MITEESIEFTQAIMFIMCRYRGPKTNAWLCEWFEQEKGFKMDHRALKNKIALAINAGGNIFENVTGRSWKLSKSLFS